MNQISFLCSLFEPSPCYPLVPYFLSHSCMPCRVRLCVLILSVCRLSLPSFQIIPLDGNNNNNDELWRVEYDDGDVEDLNRRELDAATIEAERLDSLATGEN